MPIYQNTHPYPEKSGEIIKKNLLNQLENPVYWNDTIKNMTEKNLRKNGFEHELKTRKMIVKFCAAQRVL